MNKARDSGFHPAAGTTRRQPGEILFYANGFSAGIFALIALILAVLQGCATLPDTNRAMTATPSQQIAFKGKDGPVSAEKSAAILERISGPADDVLQKHLAYEQAVNIGSPLVLGNKLTLLQNGPATYQAMFSAIRQARHNINLETYIFDDDEAGKKFVALLLEKQAQGVQVNIVYDSIGSLGTPEERWAQLRAAGIRVLEFNPVNPLGTGRKPWRLNNRDHRRQLVIDGRIAFTGGINISSSYSSSPRGKHSNKPKEATPDETTGWRDTHIRIEGPAVAEFQKLFMATWARQKGEALTEKNYFPVLKAQGKEIVRAIGSTPDDLNNPIYLTLISAITHAEQSVHLTVAYFAPDPQLRRALIDAARRGVDVRLVLPSHTDSWPIFNLGRSYYTELLRGGVTIYERHGSVMHAKTACIDGIWSTIGSTNLDWRSFLHNDEINAVILGQAFGTQMESMFAADIVESDVIKLDQWEKRSWGLRMKEQIARLGAYWL